MLYLPFLPSTFQIIAKMSLTLKFAENTSTFHIFLKMCEFDHNFGIEDLSWHVGNCCMNLSGILKIDFLIDN